MCYEIGLNTRKISDWDIYMFEDKLNGEFIYQINSSPLEKIRIHLAKGGDNQYYCVLTFGW